MLLSLTCSVDAAHAFLPHWAVALDSYTTEAGVGLLKDESRWPPRTVNVICQFLGLGDGSVLLIASFNLRRPGVLRSKAAHSIHT